MRMNDQKQVLYVPRSSPCVSIGFNSLTWYNHRFSAVGTFLDSVWTLARSNEILCMVILYMLECYHIGDMRDCQFMVDCFILQKKVHADLRLSLISSTFACFAICTESYFERPLSRKQDPRTHWLHIVMLERDCFWVSECITALVNMMWSVGHWYVPFAYFSKEWANLAADCCTSVNEVAQYKIQRERKNHSQSMTTEHYDFSKSQHSHSRKECPPARGHYL